MTHCFFFFFFLFCAFLSFLCLCISVHMLTLLRDRTLKRWSPSFGCFLFYFISTYLVFLLNAITILFWICSFFSLFLFTYSIQFCHSKSSFFWFLFITHPKTYLVDDVNAFEEKQNDTYDEWTIYDHRLWPFIVRDERAFHFIFIFCYLLILCFSSFFYFYRLPELMEHSVQFCTKFHFLLSHFY